MQFPWTGGGQTFKTKTDLEKHIKVEINYKNRRPNVVFQAPVLAALFYEENAAYKGILPFGFSYQECTKRTHQDELSANLPGYGWVSFSKKNLLTPLTFEEKFKQICRNRFSEYWRPQRTTTTYCEFAGCTALGEDLDHVFPQQADIVKDCFPLVSSTMKVSWEAHYRLRGAKTSFQVDYQDPSMIEFDRQTSSATFQYLCQKHHKQVTAERKNSNVKPTKKVRPPTTLLEDENVDALFQLLGP